MLVDLNKPITGAKQEPIKDKEKVVSLQDMILLAFIQPDPNARGSTPQDALKERKLFRKIDEAKDSVELSADEVVLIKDIVAARLTRLMAGAVIELIDP